MNINVFKNHFEVSRATKNMSALVACFFKFKFKFLTRNTNKNKPLPLPVLLVIILLYDRRIGDWIKISNWQAD